MRHSPRPALVVLGVLALLTLGSAPVSATTGPLAAASAPGSAPGPLPGAAEEPATPTTWTVQPATAEGPDGRVSLRHVLDPGASVTEHVAVTNFSDHEATFVVYAGDGTVTGSGDFDVPPGDGRRQDGGAWVTLGLPEGAEQLDDGRLRLTLGPSAVVTVPLTIAVPADAAPGDHPAGVVAELAGGATAVRLAARVGTRLHLRVTGEIGAVVVPDLAQVRWEPSWNPFAPGQVHVRHVVRNAGDVRLGARSEVALAGPAGLGAARSTSEVRELLPGRTVVVESTLRVWPVLRATGRVDVTPLVVGEDTVDVPLRPTSTSVAVWTPPWSQLLLVLVLAGGVLLARWQRRRTAQQVQARVDAALAAAGVTREPATARAATPSVATSAATASAGSAGSAATASDATTSGAQSADGSAHGSDASEDEDARVP